MRAIATLLLAVFLTTACAGERGVPGDGVPASLMNVMSGPELHRLSQITGPQSYRIAASFC